MSTLLEFIAAEFPEDTLTIQEPSTTIGMSPNPVVKPVESTSWTQDQVVGTLKFAVDQLWTAHLDASEYVTHIALDDLYHQLLSHVDHLIETILSFNVDFDVKKIGTVFPYGVTEGDVYNFCSKLREITMYGRQNYWSGFNDICAICDDIDKALSDCQYKIRRLAQDNPFQREKQIPSLAAYAKKF